MTPFMEWNLNCLRAIAELRTPLLDTLMQGVTELGGETLFMLFMLVVFWCCLLYTSPSPRDTR